MANGTYGIKKPAYITSNDVDIYYYYSPSRSTQSSDFTAFKKLDSTLLATMNDPDGLVLPGAFNLRLPLDTFSSKGIYNVYIKPKEYIGTIADVSVLNSFPNVRGIVLSISGFTNLNDTSIFENNELVGYRVEYFDANDIRQTYYRIITSNNYCEPVAQNLNNNDDDKRYRFNDSSTLVFCTLTPSTDLTIKGGAKPYIGTVGQKIALINTKFNPIMLEIEMVEHDADSLYTITAGDQTRNLDNGLITTFNKDGEIVTQSVYGNITNTTTDIHHDFKINNEDNIQFNEKEKLEEIKDNI